MHVTVSTIHQGCLIPSYQKGVIVCGDGRMNSPWFCATKGTYSFMEEGGSHRVVNMEHGDKRQVHRVVNMEHGDKRQVHATLFSFL